MYSVIIINSFNILFIHFIIHSSICSLFIINSFNISFIHLLIHPSIYFFLYFLFICRFFLFLFMQKCHLLLRFLNSDLAAFLAHQHIVKIYVFYRSLLGAGYCSCKEGMGERTQGSWTCYIRGLEKGGLQLRLMEEKRDCSHPYPCPTKTKELYPNM